MNYSELLRDPRWQKKRLEILELDAWRCRRCENKEKTLHVHHLYYIKFANPWDYTNDALVTLCEDCHEAAPKVQWQRAFLDLNMTEFDLLDLAIVMKFRKQKFSENVSQVAFRERHQCRELWPYMWYDLFDTEDELNEFYQNAEKYKSFYRNG